MKSFSPIFPVIFCLLFLCGCNLYNTHPVPLTWDGVVDPRYVDFREEAYDSANLHGYGPFRWEPPATPPDGWRCLPFNAIRGYSEGYKAGSVCFANETACKRWDPTKLGVIMKGLYDPEFDAKCELLFTGERVLPGPAVKFTSEGEDKN